MTRCAILIFSVLFGLSQASWADMPYPLNPHPCPAADQSADCIPATQFSQYLFLPTTTPPTLPNDWSDDDWKLTSEKTGDLTIDNNPQELFGVKGVSVDLAWQVTTGRPDVMMAVLDSGIEWQNQQPDLVNKLHLNRGELPVPEGSTNTLDPYDRNGDGFFNIQDYLADGTHAQDSRVSDLNGNGMIDPEDLIFRFSDGVDDDHNGYVDDICGWDFFEDDNDALDEVQYGHGTGEARDSNAEANNGGGDPGTCPSCMVMPIRVGDSFVAEVNNFAQAVIFATDSGARVVQEALGTLNNSSFAQAAVDYAYAHGVIVVASAADEESNHHNYPANYNHTLEVNSVNRWNNFNGIEQTPHSYLYLNGCTNYGAHIAVSVESSSCSSEATGKSSGIAGLVYSAALNEIDAGRLSHYPSSIDGPSMPLSANEVKQILTTTADDINFDARPDLNPPLPQNYMTTSPLPDVIMSERYHSIAGFDQYFGYGRINANTAVRRVQADMIPPEAEISTPDWFQVVNPDTGTLAINGRVAAVRTASYTYTVDVAPGVQPAESDFVAVAMGQGTAPLQGKLADLSLTQLAGLMPHGVDGPAVDDHGLPDRDRFTATVRVRIVDNLGNHGEDRRAFALHRDPSLVGGQPLRLGTDGTSSPVLADLDGDGVEDIILATSDGVVHAYHGSTMTELPGWPVHTDPIEVHSDAPGFVSGLVPAPYGAILGTPAVGDLDHNGRLEVVAADMNGKLYVWESNGQLRPGFPVSTLADYSFTHRSERDLSTPDGQVPDRKNRHNVDNRLGRAFMAGPALGNLDGSADGSLEIIIGAWDRHVYAWHADGTPVPGWPALVKDPSKVLSVDPVTNEVTMNANAKALYGTKIIEPVSLGDIDGDGTLDVVVGVNEEYGERPNAIFENEIIGFLRASGSLKSGNGRTYALFHDGTAHGATPLDHGWNPDAIMPGWPVKIAMLTTELLPTVGSGQDGPPALADLDHDGRPEIGVFSLGPAYVFNGQGKSFLGGNPASAGIPLTLEADVFGTATNSVDMPMYTGIGGGILAEMGGRGNGFQFIAPGLGLGALANADLNSNQTPADNLVGMWRVANGDGTPATGQFEPAFPRVVNDMQFLTAASVADIDGDGLPETLEGSDVYDLHAFNINGVEPAGWPKFTGGWIAATAAIGDILGDGHLQVVAITREGSLFVWKMPGSECSDIQWRKGHHDEWNTGNYDMDTRPPAPILPATATLTADTGGLVDLDLSAVPGSDLYCGATADFDVRFAAQPISSDAAFAAATPFTIRGDSPSAGRSLAGTLELQAPPPLTAGTVYVAARVSDAAGNRSIVTDMGQTTIEGGPTPTFLPTNTPTITPTPTVTPTIANTPSPTAGPPTLTPTPVGTCPPGDVTNSAPTCACVDDCNSDGSVFGNEVTKAVNIVAGADLSTCPQADANSDGEVFGNEVTIGVNNVANGCPGAQ